MNIGEVIHLWQQLEEQKLSRAYLQAEKPLNWRPRGEKLRTPFGYADILSVSDKETSTFVQFSIETVKIKRWLEKEIESQCQAAIAKKLKEAGKCVK